MKSKSAPRPSATRPRTVRPKGASGKLSSPIVRILPPDSVNPFWTLHWGEQDKTEGDQTETAHSCTRTERSRADCRTFARTLGATHFLDGPGESRVIAL